MNNFFTKRNSYSQFGEDSWILENIELPKKGFYLDIGAGDGIFHSNTKILEDNGWEGICFEPNMESFLSLVDNRDTEKTECLLNAISDKFEIKEFYSSEEYPYISGYHKPYIGKYQKSSIAFLDILKVLDRLNVNKIDLLSIDCEGNEVKIAKRIMEKVKPTIMIVEFLTQEKINKEVAISFLEDYEIVHTTTANHIFKYKY